jgi:hypothetical protein
MKNLYFLPAHALTFSFLLSCQGIELSEIAPFTKCRNNITELHYSMYVNHSIYFTYSDDGRITERISKMWSESELYGLDTARYEYDAANHVSNIVFNPSSYSTFMYDNDNNLIQSAYNIISENGEVFTHETKYLYDGHALWKIQFNHGRDSIIFRYDTKGNLSTKTTYYNGIQYIKETYLSYDDHPNPFRGNLFIFPYGINLEDIDYFSANNVLEYKVEYGNHTDISPHVNKYTYNDDGYWTNGSILYNSFFSIHYQSCSTPITSLH